MPFKPAQENLGATIVAMTQLQWINYIADYLPTKMDNEDVQFVDSFTYLGSRIKSKANL